MSRIADKHGLTNQYREVGKRVVKRGRPRKYLFGAPNKKSRNNNIVVDKKTEAVILISTFFIFLIAFFSFVPVFRCMLPIIIGILILLVVNSIMKWPTINHNGKIKTSYPLGWTFFTIAEMIINFIMVLLIQVWKMPVMVLIINVIAYIIISIWLLYNERKKKHASSNLIEPIEKI